MSELVSESEVEMLPKTAEVLVVLDVDRTLINTDKTADIILNTVKTLVGNEVVIEQVRSEKDESVGNAFDFIGRVEELTGADITAEALVDEIMSTYDSEELARLVLVEGSLEFLEAVAAARYGLVLATAGQEKNQTIKVLLINEIVARHSRCGQLPWVIVDEAKQRKTELVKEAYNPDAREFDLDTFAAHGVASPGVSGTVGGVKEVWVVDDKQENVTDVDVDAIKGFLMMRAEGRVSDPGATATMSGLTSIVSEVHLPEQRLGGQ